MKKIILSIFLLMATLGFSQNYNGTYKNEWGLTIKISNHSKEKGILNFEVIGVEYPCEGSRKEIAVNEEDLYPPNEYMYRPDSEDGIVNLIFNTNGSLTIKPGEEGGFYYEGNCAIFSEETFKKIVPKKAPVKKKTVKK